MEARRERHERLLGQELRQFGTEAVNLRLQAIIEHVANHGHAAPHPLAATTQFPVVKLRHRAIAVHEGLQQRHHCVRTDRVSASYFINLLAALVGQLLQRVAPGVRRDVTRAVPRSPYHFGWPLARRVRVARDRIRGLRCGRCYHDSEGIFPCGAEHGGAGAVSDDGCRWHRRRRPKASKEGNRGSGGTSERVGLRMMHLNTGPRGHIGVCSQ
jgi:hypothetical protein